MKIFGICASPRNNTTEYALSKAMRRLNEEGFETEMFTCQSKDIKPCMHCDYCWNIKNA